MNMQRKSMPVMETDRILKLLGLAKRAGRLKSGSFQTEEAVKGGKATLVLITEDSSEASKKGWTDMCEYYEVPYIFFGKKEELGHALGMEYRAVAALTDQGFADKIKSIAEER